MAGKKDIVNKALKFVGDYFAPNTDEYAKNLDTFFGGTDPSLRRRLYTGTSKDKDFSAFQESRHGTWLTANPEEASDYAMQNDSQSLRMIPGTWSYEPVNSASRVIPTYARVDNPYRGELPDFARVDNYKKAQSDWFDKLRAQGYDAWVPDSRKGEMVVVLKDQGNKVKSAIGNAGTFDLSKRHMNKAEGGLIREGYGPGGWVDDVVKMAGKVIEGEGEDAAKAGIRAYHGSPHDFDKFSLDKIGTGEGAQAYGHGLYFAENEGVARGYRDTLSSSPFRTANSQNPNDIAAGALKLTRGNRAAAAQMLKDNLFDVDLGAGAEPVRAAASLLESGVDIRPPGHMYEVEINADPDAFLDWDKPLSEQPEAVRKLFPSVEEAKLLDAQMEKLSVDVLANPNNKDLQDAWDAAYRSPKHRMASVVLNEANPKLGGKFASGDKAYSAIAEKPSEASALLKEAGIPGIKYLDAGSRGKGVAQVQVMYKGKPHGDPIPVQAWNQVDQLTNDYKAKGYDVEVQDIGTRNYVVFDDKLISIIRKYGIAGASAMLGYNLMEQLDPKQALAASMADQDYQASRPQKSMGGNNSISGALNVARGLNGGE